MANKVTIDVEARFIDNVTDEAKAAAKSFEKIEKAAEEAQKDVKNLGKTKPKVDVDSSRAMKKLGDMDKKLNKLGRSKTEAKLTVKDKATAIIDKVTAKAKAFAGKTYSGLVKIRDSNVLSTLNKMSTGIKGLTSKAWNVAIRIKDTFTAPLTKLKNMLFNVRTLIAGIASAWAAVQLVKNPINVADAYSSAKISFSTLLGETKGQQMMNDLDAFAKATPFNTTNVIGNAQKMLAMGWDAENIVKDMEIIGNAAAATGKLDQGLESIVRALSQIKTKGRLSTEELNQLAEAGISAKAMLAENLGYGTGDTGIAAMTKDLEDGAIASDVALQALLAGMRKYDGMMDSMANETVEGLISQIGDAFSINVVRKWGQGLQDGARRGLGTVISLLDEAEAAMANLGDTLYELGRTVSNWAADKLERAIERITTITGTSKFKNASLGGQISMLWKGVVVDPLQEWWDNGGAQKTAETAGKIGAAMGTMMTKGLLALFGATDALDGNFGTEAGSNIAGSFVQGFLDNFDGAAITGAFVDAIDNVWDALPAWAKAVFGLYGAGKAAGGIAKAAEVTTKVIGGNVVDEAGTIVGATGLKGLIGSTGNAMVSGTGILGWLAKAGYALKGGVASAGAYFGAGMGGAAAAGLGAAGIAGGLLGVNGAVSGVADIVNGATSSGKEAQDSYFKGGSKIGMVGAGAAVGAAIGSAVPVVGTAVGALAGAGVGGLASLLGGDAFGEWLSDMTDNLPAMGEAISEFFTNTLPEKWNDFWDSVGNFFSEKVPYAVGYAAGKVTTFFSETLPEKWTAFWTAVGNFFTETIPTWADNVWNNKIVPFWTETLPGFFPKLWDSIDRFFTESLPSIGSAIWSAISGFFTETIPNWVNNALNSVSSWWGGVKDSFSKGFDAGSGKDAGYRGGIFGGESAMDAYARGGIVGGSTRFIRVNEEAPEMIIPLSSQRRDRATKLWAKTGEILGVQDEGLRHRSYGSSSSAGGIQVNMGGFTLEVNVTGSEGVAEAIKAQAGELADYFVGIIADALETEFENTPVRGGA